MPLDSPFGIIMHIFSMIYALEELYKYIMW